MNFLKITYIRIRLERHNALRYFQFHPSHKENRFFLTCFEKKPWYFLSLLLKEPPFKFEANQENTPLVQALLIDLI